MNRGGLLANLPSEIIIDIISRLPVRSIIRCKRVCKSWLNLLNTPEFIESHHSKSTPGLAVLQYQLPEIFLMLFEVEDEIEPEHHELHYIPITEFDVQAFMRLFHSIVIQGSAKGLLLLREISQEPDSLYICNPITREYTKISSLETKKRYYPTVVTYGFGVSSLTGQYKVIRISHDRVLDPDTQELLSIPRNECHIYALQTGSWRSIRSGEPMEYNCRSNGVLLNGSLHWFVKDLKGSFLISCLDLEREVFTTFSSPFHLPESQKSLVELAALEGSLCLCDNSSENEIVIWIMKEYGVEKSWSKEFVISKFPNHVGETYETVHPIKIFKDGDILMCWGDLYLFYYCHKTKAIQPTSMTGHSLEAIFHSPTFLSLKNLNENVIVSTF
ncbi:F-box protein At3g07870-like [Andrographis paniculata]|uniref:F-box protein At3g07870-like n=1 Tax=Andrographis paniculata TaxID=175694 RepID=UPI0021E789C7|nr:F-box protein At3g07870-like [Andrographis paniculata]